MTTVYDVPPESLIEHAAKLIQEKVPEVKPPEWASYVKTGPHKEKPPLRGDWWYVRAASVLRKLYVKGPLGTVRLAAMYGGPRDRGSKPDRAVKGSRAIIRHILQQLEDAKLVEKASTRGRRITPKGQKLLDNAAREVYMDIIKNNTELAKY